MPTAYTHHYSFVIDTLSYCVSLPSGARNTMDQQLGARKLCVHFTAPIQWLTTFDSSSSKGITALFWLLQALHIWDVYKCRETFIHSKKEMTFRLSLEGSYEMKLNFVLRSETHEISFSTCTS